MRRLKILAGILIVGLLCIPCLIVGTGNVGFEDHTLKQNPHLKATYVPRTDEFGKKLDGPHDWRVRGSVTNAIATYAVSCGTGFSGHPPTYQWVSTATSTSYLNDLDTNSRPTPRQAKLDIMWQELPEPFYGEGPRFSTAFPSKYFTLAWAKSHYDPYGETTVTDARTCSQLLTHRHLTTFFASPLGWLVILGCIALGLYILMAGRGGGGGGGVIRGHATRNYAGTGYNISIGNTSGHSTPSLGGSGEDIKLYPRGE